MTAIAAVVGVALDQLVGEPPVAWHPVARYGLLMTRIEHSVYADRRSNGVAFTLIGVGIGVVTGTSLRRTIGRSASSIVATAVCSAGRMLDSEAKTVARLTADGDLPAARARLRSLVGRTADHLDEPEISRAVIESVAENSVDAVVSSLIWATIGGAPAVLAHRAVNTLDAMVGHRNTRYECFGWASARLDDFANYVPARFAAMTVALARPTRAPSIWRAVRRDAARHPSPNGGVIEAAYAAALDVRLGGVNLYHGAIEDRGTLGTGPKPTATTIDDAISLRRQATAIGALLMLVVPALRFRFRRWR